MAQAVMVARNDTLTSILKRQRGINSHTAHAWLTKIRQINPHISDPNRIYPGEKILIPDTANETVSRHQIWDNAFSNIPSSLNAPHQGNTALYITNGSETIDMLASKIFATSPQSSLPHGVKRAILIHNNPCLEQCLAANRIPMGTIINLSPVKLKSYDKAYWHRESATFLMNLNQFDPAVMDLYQQAGPDDTLILAEMAKYLKNIGASVGSDSLVRGMGYGVGGLSGLAASGEASLKTVNTLAADLYAEAIKKFGKSIVSSHKAHHLSQLQRFLKGHPKYQILMSHLKKLPNLIMPKGRLMPKMSAAANFPVARHMRKQFFLANMKPGLAQRMGSIASGLNGKVRLMKGMGFAATWAIPAVLSLITITNAPADRRVQTLMEEGFSIIGGAVGTTIGTSLGIAIGTALALNPFGVFVVVFVCASAVGLGFSEIGKNFGSSVYDLGDILSNRTFYSFDEMIGIL